MYRLINIDIEVLKKEYEELEVLIKELRNILDNYEVFLVVIKDELNEIKKKFKVDWLFIIEVEIFEIKIDKEVMVFSEEVILSLM